MNGLQIYYENLAQYVLWAQKEVSEITDIEEGTILNQKLSSLYYLIYQQIQELVKDES